MGGDVDVGYVFFVFLFEMSIMIPCIHVVRHPDSLVKSKSNREIGGFGGSRKALIGDWHSALQLSLYRCVLQPRISVHAIRRIKILTL